MDTLSDNALMLKVKEGDVDKMTLLYERHYRPLFGYIFRMTRHRELSEDLVQNVFFRMLKYRESFQGRGEFRAWMYHLARNVLNDHYKKAKNAPSHTDLREFEGRMEEGLTADAQIEKNQELKILEEAMKSIPKEDRELLILCRYQELKYSEIAQILNTTEGAVKVRVHRAMNELKATYLKIEN